MNAKLIYSALLFSSLLFSCDRASKENHVSNTMIADIESNGPPCPRRGDEKQNIPVGS
jgi:hypothetical protein